MRSLLTATTVPSRAGGKWTFPQALLPFWHECRRRWQRISCQDVLCLLPLLLALQTPPASAPTSADVGQLAAPAVAGAPTPYVRVIGSASEQGGKLSGWQGKSPQLASGLATSDWLLVDFHNPGKVQTAGAMALNDGSWLPGVPAPMLDESPAWQLAGLPAAIALPLNTLWLQSFGQARHPKAQEEMDQLWISTSSGGVDRQRGYLLEWNAEGLLFETTAGERHFAWPRVLGLGLFVEQTPAQKDAVWIQLTNGGVLSARIHNLHDGYFDLELAWGKHWLLPVGAVQRVRRRFDVEELAHAEAWQVVEHPVSEVLNWAPRFGKSVEGRPLQLGSAVYAQGIGVKVGTHLQREVKQSGLLLLTVGVDMEVQYFRQPQPVVFEVWLDQTLLITSGARSFQDAPLVLKVPVAKAGTLKLVAKPAGVLPYGGHADFADVVWVAQ